MNGPAAQIAKSRENLARLNALFAHLETVEPKLITAAENAFFAEIDLLMPRLRAYALETGNQRLQVTLTMEVNFDPAAPGIAIASRVVPPAYEHRSEVSAT